VPNLQRLVDAYKQALDGGNADVLSYYVAWNNLAQKRLGVLRLQQQLADTRVALELAAGRYFPDEPTTRPTTDPTARPQPEEAR
jgi:cobalt-zinc-cadmium efflux system outer membrane protein